MSKNVQELDDQEMQRHLPPTNIQRRPQETAPTLFPWQQGRQQPIYPKTQSENEREDDPKI